MDIHLIQLSLEGFEERDHHHFQMMFASQGLELPDLPRKRPQNQRASAEQIKAWAAANNARIAANKKAAQAAKGAPLEKEGGGPPPRPKKEPKKKPEKAPAE